MHPASSHHIRTSSFNVSLQIYEFMVDVNFWIGFVDDEIKANPEQSADIQKQIYSS